MPAGGSRDPVEHSPTGRLTGGLTIAAHAETWPLAQAFVISRGSKTEARVVVVEVSDGVFVGRGESVPYTRYGETVAGVVAQVEAAGAISDRGVLQTALPPGAARNALDCALWDLEAKRRAMPAYRVAGLADLKPLVTAFTLSLATPADMAAAALRVPRLKLLKLKLGGVGDPDRMMAVRQARPDARLVADANEAWTVEMLTPFLAAAARAKVDLIEQPLPAALDEVLRDVPRPVALCADESAHVSSDLARLAGLYDAVNIKLDKTGGLTEALVMAQSAETMGFEIMVGCMVATSLAMAPACLIAQRAQWVDLDGPLLLACDRVPGLDIRDGVMQPPSAALWG